METKEREEIKRELSEKAAELEACPGVYLMKDAYGRVIYVGKSRKLKNRVSQYFREGIKDVKTRRMVSSVRDFDTILCDTEIEALTLENNLIKKYSPKYNIRLKDAKSYPFIKITEEEYPRLVCTRKREDDRAEYFGPYAGTSVVYSVIDTLNKTLGLPACKLIFPRDIGKRRPCIYYQMGRCSGLCAGKVTKEEHAESIKKASEILRGNIPKVRRELFLRMEKCSEEEKYEDAAKYRDTIAAIDRIREKQKALGKPGTDRDVFALYNGETASCVSVFNIRNGVLTGSRDHLFSAGEISDEGDMAGFICDQYGRYGNIPPEILISFETDEVEREALEYCLSESASHKVSVRTPVRGELKSLCDMALKNAADRVESHARKAVRNDETLAKLASLCGLEVVPSRIEAYDVSKYGRDSVIAGMIVFENGKFKKSDYRSFNISAENASDDYAAMREAVSRRLARLDTINDAAGNTAGIAAGSFSERPDLILLDGGKGHLGVITDILNEKGIKDIAVAGMVKDDYHKTRALVTAGGEVRIASEKDVFALIYSIQEEVHRYAFGKTEKSKRKTLKTSSLTAVHGIGEKKAGALLRHFGGLGNIRKATKEELSKVKGLSEKDAESVWIHFHSDEL